MRRRYPDHRFRVGKERVTHFTNSGERCFICGAPATHYVMEGGTECPPVMGINLCTYHFARMFKMPASRFPKKKVSKEAKKILAAMDKRLFTLRRHMDIPLTFAGERLISHHFSTPQAEWFIALYQTISGKMFVSSARVFGKNFAVNMVEEVQGRDFIEAAKRTIHAHEVVFKIDEYQFPGVTVGFTEFFGKAAQYAAII